MASLDVPDMAYLSESYSSGEYATANDAIAVKYDQNGNMIWQRNLTDAYGIPRLILVSGDTCIVLCEGEGTVLLKMNPDGEI